MTTQHPIQHSILNHIVRELPRHPPRRIGEWVAELGPHAGGGENAVLHAIRQGIDDGVLSKRGSQHRTAAHTLRLSQRGYELRAHLLLDDRKAGQR
jgi:hypothetical protein